MIDDSRDGNRPKVSDRVARRAVSRVAAAVLLVIAVGGGWFMTSRGPGETLATPPVTTQGAESPSNAVELPNEDSALPTVHAEAYVMTPSLAELVQLGDNAVRAKLISIDDSSRIIVDREDAENAEERIGLVFEVAESYLGTAATGDEIRIAGPGYRFNADTNERTAKISVNGVSIDSWSIGEDYVFFYLDIDVGLRFRSQELMGHLAKDGTVTPISELGTIPEFQQANEITQLVQLINTAAMQQTPAP